MTRTLRYSLATAACVASLALTASPAAAAQKNLGTTPATIVDLSTADTGNGGNFVGPGATFTDNYYFHLTSGNSGAFTLFNVVASTPMGNYYAIANLAASVFDLTTSTLVGGFSGSTDPTATTSLALTTGDNYRIGVSGTGSGSHGGLYAVSVTPQTVAPLPGPSGWAVALAGGGLLAVGIRRRRGTKATSAA